MLARTCCLQSSLELGSIQPTSRNSKLEQHGQETGNQNSEHSVLFRLFTLSHLCCCLAFFAFGVVVSQPASCAFDNWIGSVGRLESALLTWHVIWRARLQCEISMLFLQLLP
jgi:hypothetical protein